MRKIPGLLGIILILLFITCRKETPRTLPENSNLIPERCANGIKDGDETAVDCGGSCYACPLVTAPCSTTVNKVALSGFATQTYTAVNCGVVSGAYTITCSNATSNMKIVFSGPSITPNQVYNIPAANPVNSNECTVDITIGTDLYSATNGGSVYLNLVNGKYVLDFCFLDTYSFSTALNKALTGNLTCN